jgi:hypothetical protein
VYVCLKEEMRKRGLDLPILAPAWAHGVWTDVDLMQTMVLAPAVAHRHFELATQWSLSMIEKYIALGIEQIGVGGDFAGNRPLISPEQYRDFIMPEILRCTWPIHAAGRWAVNASDGDLWPVIEDYLIGCEVDGYVEIDMHAGMDLARLKRAYGSRVTFYGNLDCGNILSFATPEGVAKHVTDCLTAGQGDGGHIHRQRAAGELPGRGQRVSAVLRAEGCFSLRMAAETGFGIRESGRNSEEVLRRFFPTPVTRIPKPASTGPASVRPAGR